MKSIQAVLAGDCFTALRDAKQRTRALQNALARALADNGIAAGDCRIQSWNDGVLRLCAPRAAAAARLRQMLPRLRLAMNERDFPVRRIVLTRFAGGGGARP